MKVEKSSSYWVRIYIAGPIDIIEQTCRKYCTDNGLCVTVSPTKYIYTGGEEVGAIIELINYPRFPEKDHGFIWVKALDLAEKIMYDGSQGSYTVMDSKDAYYYSRREEFR